MNWLNSIRFFLGWPRRVMARCYQCRQFGRVIDLGDGDYICDECWREWK